MMAMRFTPFDEHMMAIAVAMARRGLGQSAPNPAVGAVIADRETGEVIARGWTQRGGRPHAETEAIRRAGARARGTAMYVTLEPCAHQGVTPPCANAIIAAGIGRVVAGIEDPDPRTAGQGFARLREAGVEVVCGVLAEEARWVTLGHVLRVTSQRPFVQVKIAVAADGSVPRGQGGRPAWVTEAHARAVGQRLRAEADAILVGARTVRDDDPELTCRLPGLASRSPVRVILSRNLDLPLAAKLVLSARPVAVLAICGAGADASRRAALQDLGVEVTEVGEADGGLSAGAVMETLAARGITRLLVEGGPSVWRSFAAAGLVDEAIVFRAGHATEGANPSDVVRQLLPGAALNLAGARRIGDDTMTVFRRA
jgi:diaminohydroxyphosphoribosylaminopyrimidine deaminase/5-amino-6-(5-phosphoribosylamino)uracil reductase